MSARIALPIFNGAPTDRLQPVDVYETTTPEVRNSYVSALSAFGQSLERSLGRQNDLLGSVRRGLTGESVDLAGAREQLNDVLRGGRGYIDKISKGLQNDILGKVGEATIGKPIRLRFGSSDFDLGYGELNNARAISQMVYDLTGSELFETLNIGAEMALFRGVLETVAEWGIPELVDDVLQEIKDEKLRKEIAKRSAYRIVSVGDIDSIETLLNSVGAETLMGLYPDLPRQLLQQYRFKPGVTPDQYPLKFTQLVSVMDRLQPNWMYTQRGSERVWNLAFVNTASDAVRLLLMSHTDYRTPVLIASEYPTRNVRTLLRGMYPLIALRS